MIKYLPSLLAAVIALLGIFADPVQAFVSSHPAVATVVAGLGAIVAHLLPSPTAPTK